MDWQNAIFAPGWVWSMLSMVLVVGSLAGLYRQLSLARGANAFTQLSALVEEWQGERLVRKRVAVLAAIRDGVVSADVPDSPAGAVANYWEKVGALARAGHLSPALVAEGLGAADSWWGILAPWVLRVRSVDANPELFEHFEWLAAALVMIHPGLAFDRESFDRTLEDRLAAQEADLRDLVATRTVMVMSSAPAGRRTGKP
jgi:hypothetical protein